MVRVFPLENTVMLVSFFVVDIVKKKKPKSGMLMVV